MLHICATIIFRPDQHWPVSLVLIVLFPLSLTAQKVEMEERISRSDFPAVALEQVVAKFPDRRREKFYRELSSADSLSFEAKFISDGYRYSVEFQPDGRLIDIEKQIRFRTVPATTQDAIHARWEADFQRFKVIKCQEQTSESGIRYEIEVRGKDGTGTDFYQYLFEADGSFVEREKIELRPSDMTLY